MKKQATRPLKPKLSGRLARSKESPFDRQFRVLEAVAAFPLGLGLTELVAVLGLPKTTVHRLLRGLTAAGVLAAQNPRFGPYVLGERFLGLLYSSIPDRWAEGIARPILKELVNMTGDTCFVARLSGNAVRSIAMATPDNDVHVYVVPGRELSPIYAASAKAILAFQDEDSVRAVLGTLNLEGSRSATILKTFSAELEAVKRTEVAYNTGEDIAGYAAVASPIHSPTKAVQFSVAVTGTYDKLMAVGNKERLGELTKQFAARLGTAMRIRLAQDQ